MKTTLYSAVTLVTCAMLVTSCAKDIEIDTNIDPIGSAISFSPSVGHSTRATEIKIGNLGDFAVVARGMHHDGVLYDNCLIGSLNAGEIAKRQSLASGENPPSSGTWTLSRNVYWPTTLNKVLFFAYTALENTTTYTDSNVLGINSDGSKPSFGFDGDMPFINNYKPLKATEIKNNIRADGENQKDLLVAYTQQEKIKSETNVPLTFEHTLTQVSITAKQDGKLTTDNRIVKIKGAWFVNVAEWGNLTTTEIKGDNNKITYNKSWKVKNDNNDNNDNKTIYGSVWSDVIQLNKSDDKDILRERSLMLIPEDLTAWDFENDKENDAKGAYIMLLCRVELEHEGTNHSGSTLGDISIDEKNKKHYHQLFPVNKEKFDATEYGFVCVPVSSTWNTEGIGKHYTYNLNICGSGTGAGKYPPTMTPEEIEALVPSALGITVVTNKQEDTGKDVGDNVLDEPIQFTVKVEGWKEPGEWTPGNGTF